MANFGTTVRKSVHPASADVHPWGLPEAPRGSAIAAELAAEGLMPCHVSLPGGHHEPLRPLGADETIWLVSGWLWLRVRDGDGARARTLLLSPGDRCDLPFGSERALEVLGDEPAYFVSGRRLGSQL